MPTIYLKERTFGKLVDTGHYHDYEEVIDRGIDMVLALEQSEKEEAAQLPKSEPSSILKAAILEKNAEMMRQTGPAEEPGESPGSTFTETPAVTVTEPPPPAEKRVCWSCWLALETQGWKRLMYVPDRGLCKECMHGDKRLMVVVPAEA